LSAIWRLISRDVVRVAMRKLSGFILRTETDFV